MRNDTLQPMESISTTITTTPTWKVYLGKQLLGEVTFTLEKTILKFTVSSDKVFGDYFGTRYNPKSYSFKPLTTYVVDELKTEDTTISGRLLIGDLDFTRNDFILKEISETELQLTMIYHKKGTRIYTKQAIKDEDEDMQVPRVYNLIAK